MFVGDIRKIKPQEMWKHKIGKVDVIVGGPTLPGIFH